jgi:hypothetical protein
MPITDQLTSVTVYLTSIHDNILLASLFWTGQIGQQERRDNLESAWERIDFTEFLSPE